MKVVQVSACLLMLHCVLCVAENERRSSRLSELLLRVLEAVEDERVDRNVSNVQTGGGRGPPMASSGGRGPHGGHRQGGNQTTASGNLTADGASKTPKGLGPQDGGNFTGAGGNRTAFFYMYSSSIIVGLIGGGGRRRNETRSPVMGAASAPFLRGLQACGSSSSSSEESLGGLGDFLTEASGLCTNNAAAMNNSLLDDFCKQATGAKAIFDGLSDTDKESLCTFSDCDAPTPDEINACVNSTIKAVAGVIEVAGGATGPIKVVLLEGVRRQMEELHDYFEDMVKENSSA